MKLKWFVYLICFLLFVAAVDTIPDPPAVSPRNGDGSRISCLHVRGSFTLPEKEQIIACASIGSSEVAWFAYRLSFISELVEICPMDFVYHVADPSPPVFS